MCLGLHEEGCASLLPLYSSCPSPKPFAYLEQINFSLGHPRALCLIRVLVPQKGGLGKEADAYDRPATSL